MKFDENRVLREIFGLEAEEEAEDWTRLDNEQLHNMYTAPNFIRVLKSRNMKWTVLVARMEEV
jgi:hypothetical protein